MNFNFQNPDQNIQVRDFNPSLVPLPQGNYNFIANLAKPYVLDIGSGTGDFAIGYAKKHPEISILAVEKTKAKFKKFSDKLKSEKDALPNLYPCHANVINLVTHYVQPQSLSACFIHYPNPYPKDSQSNKRFYRMPFFGYLKSRLIRNGEIHFSTNLLGTMNEAKYYLSEVWGLSLIQMCAVESHEEPLTAFERKYLARGETCWRLRFQLKK